MGCAGFGTTSLFHKEALNKKGQHGSALSTTRRSLGSEPLGLRRWRGARCFQGTAWASRREWQGSFLKRTFSEGGSQDCFWGRSPCKPPSRLVLRMSLEWRRLWLYHMALSSVLMKPVELNVLRFANMGWASVGTAPSARGQAKTTGAYHCILEAHAQYGRCVLIHADLKRPTLLTFHRSLFDC